MTPSEQKRGRPATYNAIDEQVMPRPSTRPMLFLDVDGVLNCNGPRQHEYDYQILGGSHVYIPHGMAGRVQALAGVFEMVWCTAWLGTAHGAFRDYLGLSDEPWPYVDYTRHKIPALLRVAGERPWAYVDDALDSWELRGLEWDRSMLSGHLIAPAYDIGLTDEHVAELLAFATPSDPKEGADA